MDLWSSSPLIKFAASLKAASHDADVSISIALICVGALASIRNIQQPGCLTQRAFTATSLMLRVKRRVSPEAIFLKRQPTPLRLIW